MKLNKISKIILSGLMVMSAICTTSALPANAAANLTMERKQAYYASPTKGDKDYSLKVVDEANGIYSIQGEKISYLLVKDDEGILVGADTYTGDYAQLKAAIEKKVEIKKLSVAATDDSMFDLSDQLKADGATVYLAGNQSQIVLDNNTENTEDDVVLTSMPVGGHTEKSTIWVDQNNDNIYSGDALGDGTLYLRDIGFFLPAYEKSLLKRLIDFRGNLDILLQGEQALINDETKIYSNNEVMDKEYVENIRTIVDDIINVDHFREHVLLMGEDQIDEDYFNYKTVEGNATVIWHMPGTGFHGYDLGGAHYKGTGYDFFRAVYNLENGKTIYNLLDTDLQSCYVIMDDKEALLIDTDMYGDITKAVKDLIGDRKLTIWITHPHPDHVGGLPEFLPVDSPVRQSAMEAHDPVKKDWEYPVKSALDDGQLVEVIFPENGSTPNYLPEFEKAGVKVTRSISGMEFSLASRDFMVYQMKGHTNADMCLIDKTDRIMFSGDVLGTDNMLSAGYNIGSAPYQEILDTINTMYYDYGKYYDYYAGGHSKTLAPKDFMLNNKILVEAYIKEGKAATFKGAGRELIGVRNTVITTQEQLNAYEPIDYYQIWSTRHNLGKYKKADTSITVANIDLIKGTKQVVTYETNNNEGTFLFESSDKNVATVDLNGNITAVGVGACEITVSVPVSANFEAATATFVVTVAPDRTVLIENVEKLEEELNKIDTNTYTKESIKVLEDALNNARVVLANENATEEEIDAALLALKDAKEQLVKIEVPEVDLPGDKDQVETGDNTQIMPYVLFIGISLVAFIATKRKKSMN